MKETEKAYVRIYTGNGQGKTTAAFGIVVRALCAGKTAYIGQFIKNEKYNETGIVIFCKHVEIEQLGFGCFLDREPDENDKAAAKAALDHCQTKIESQCYDVIVLDELCLAIYYGFVTVQEVIDVLNKRNELTEIIITGRYAPQELIDYADLVTEMKEIKHYYQEGVLSRNGFDH